MRLLAGVLSLFAVAACGDEDKVRHLPDAPPPPDAAVDASTSGAVTLTVIGFGGPQEGVRVVFQAADGAVVADLPTGADGKASAVVEAGAYVTALDPLPIPQGVVQRDLRTFAGVKPGDQLVLRDDVEGATVNVTVVVPIDSGAQTYTLYTNCGSYDVSGPGGSGSEPGGAVSLFGCGATTDLVVETRDFSSVKQRALVKANVALVEGGTIDLSAETYAAIPDTTFAYTNVPAGLFSVSLYGQLVTTRGLLVELFENGNVSGGASTITTKRPSVPGATAVNLSTFRSEGNTQHTVIDWAPSAAAYALDVGAALLAGFASAPALDPAAHTIAWTLASTGAQPDFAHVTSFYTRETGGLLAWRWEIVGPSATSVTLPVLPGELAMFNPVASDTVFHEVEIAKVPGGYDAVRAHALSAGGVPGIGVGASGRALTATFVEAVLARVVPPFLRPALNSRVR